MSSLINYQHLWRCCEVMLAFRDVYDCIENRESPLKTINHLNEPLALSMRSGVSVFQLPLRHNI